MPEQRRTYAWHELLESMEPVKSGRSQKPATQESLDLGWEIHARIEAMFPEWRKEKAAGGVFSDPDLPFDVTYSPDLWDEAGGAVWDIKPAVFCLRNMDRCVAQLSGYRHFKEATEAGFLLYSKFFARDGDVRIDGPWPFVPRALVPWERLRGIALASHALLLEREAAA